MSPSEEIPPIPTPTPEQAAPPAPLTDPVVPNFEAPGDSYPASPVPPAPSGYAPVPPPYGSQPAYGSPIAFAPFQPRGLSLASMICGIGGLFLSLFSLGLLPSVAAVILGHIASKRQPWAKSLSVTGLITGYIGIGISVLWGAILVIVVVVGIVGTNNSNY